MNAMETPDFHARLQAAVMIARRWRLLVWTLLTTAAFLAMLLVWGLTDFWLGWESETRVNQALALGLGVAAAVLAGWLRARRFSPREVAALADQTAAGGRGEFASALDLLNTPRTGGGLHDWLAARAISQADARLEQVPRQAWVPRQALRQAAFWLGGALLLLGGVAVLNTAAAGWIAHRLLHPATELPPWSPWQFTFSPAQPEVVYGREVELGVSLEGPPLMEDVVLLTRPGPGGAVTRLPTFQEAGRRFSRKLEGVTQPLEFAFAAGRARSGWHPLKVLFQPRLESAVVELTPPAYSGRPAMRFPLGTEEVRGLRGTRVSLQVESNRPLAGGALEGRKAQGKEVVARVKADPVEAGAKAVRFSWTLQDDLVWTLDIQDIGGGHMEEPVLVAQRLVPDEKPVVEVVSPGTQVLATPGSALKLAWDFSDDLGLDKTEWMRAMGTFRDRTAPLDNPAGETRLRVERTVELARLGAAVGQTLEFVAEARDRNPALTGIGTADPVQVQIISEEDYAAMVRERTTLEEFVERYNALTQQLEAAKAALEKVERAAKTADPAALAEAVAEAAAAQREAAKWFESFAKEFPAYATDKQLSELAGGLKEQLEQNAGSLEKQNAWRQPAEAAKLARQMAEALLPGQQRLEAEQANAEEYAKVGAVLEMAAELQAAREEQTQVSEALTHLAEEMALGNTNHRHQLPDLRARQMENQRRVERVRRELPKRLAELPPGYDDLRAGGEKVLDGLDLLQIPQQMAGAAAKAGEGKLTGAAADAVLARANLDQLLGECPGDFGSACKNGGMPGFCQGGGTAGQTLAQMLAALRARARPGVGAGRSPGSGGGGGLGALGGSGAAMEGIQLEIPLIGPPRVSLNQQPRRGTGGASADTSQGTAAAQSKASEASTLPSGTTAGARGKAWNPEEVPPRYRDAVKNYFTPPAQDTAPGPAPGAR